MKEAYLSEENFSFEFKPPYFAYCNFVKFRIDTFFDVVTSIAMITHIIEIENLNLPIINSVTLTILSQVAK